MRFTVFNNFFFLSWSKSNFNILLFILFHYT